MTNIPKFFLLKAVPACFGLKKNIYYDCYDLHLHPCRWNVFGPIGHVVQLVVVVVVAEELVLLIVVVSVVVFELVVVVVVHLILSILIQPFLA